MTKSARAILAEHVQNARKSAQKSGLAKSRRAWAAVVGCDIKLVERAEKPDALTNGMSLQNLEVLAKAMNMQPWQLLHPGEAVVRLSEEALEIAQLVDGFASVEQRQQALRFFEQLKLFANAT